MILRDQVLLTSLARGPEPGPAAEFLEMVSQLVLDLPEKNLPNQSCSC